MNNIDIKIKMNFLKEDYNYINSPKELLLEIRKFQSEIMVKNSVLSYLDTVYTDFLIFKGIEKIMKSEFLHSDLKNDIVINNDLFLSSLKSLDFLFKTEIAFGFKIKDNEIFDYVVSSAVLLNNTYFFTRDSNFILDFANKLDFICLKGIGKNFNNLKENDIELLKILKY